MSDLPEQPPRESWEPYGACLGCDPALFFPERGSPCQQAKAVCAGCPVQRECLEFAVRTNQQFGIWGGLSRRERRRLRGHNVAPSRGQPPQFRLVQGGRS